MKSFFERYALLWLLLFAFLLRLAGIFSRPIWYDEAFSLLFASKGFAAMLAGTLTSTGAGAADIHPLGYYTLLDVWMKVLGTTVPAGRLLSALLGVGIVFLAYQTANYFAGRKLALWAAFFVAISPFQVHYGQEIRMYALLTFLLLVAVYAFLRGIKDGNLGWTLLFSLAAALAQCTHNLAAFFLLPLAFTAILLRRKEVIWRTLWAGGLALLFYSPWLFYLPSQLGKVQAHYWVQKPGADALFNLLLTYVTNLPVPDGWLGAGLFITLILVGLAVWQTYRYWRAEPFSLAGLWFFYLAFLPPLLLFLVSQWTPVFIARALLPAGVFFSLWLAWVFEKTDLTPFLQKVFLTLLIFSAALGFCQHLTYAGFPYADYAAITEEFSAEHDAPGLILHSNKLSALPAFYYAPDLPQKYIADEPGSGSDTLALATQQTLGFFSSADMETATQNADRVALVIFEKAIAEYQAAGYATHPHLSWLAEHYSSVEVLPRGDIILYIFSDLKEPK